MSRILIYAGIALLAIGLLARFVPLGRLPGDIVYRRGNFTIAIPIVTMLLLNLLLAFVLWIRNRH